VRKTGSLFKQINQPMIVAMEKENGGCKISQELQRIETEPDSQRFCTLAEDLNIAVIDEESVPVSTG
jgi:hypothetical protein